MHLLLRSSAAVAFDGVRGGGHGRSRLKATAVHPCSPGGGAVLRVAGLLRGSMFLSALR